LIYRKWLDMQLSRTSLFVGGTGMSYRAMQVKAFDEAAATWRNLAREARSNAERDECLSFRQVL